MPNPDELIRAAYQYHRFADGGRLTYAEYRSRVMGVALLYALGRAQDATGRADATGDSPGERDRIGEPLATLLRRERDVHRE